MEGPDGSKMPKKVAAELDKLIDSIPSIPITEKWGQMDEKGMKSAERVDFENRLKSFLKGADPIDRLENFIAKVNGEVDAKPSNSISEIFNRIVVMRTINNIVTGFSPSGAGFIFEALTAAIMNGRQVVEKEDGQLGIADVEMLTGEPFSMKLLSKQTDLKGSKLNLEAAVKRHGAVTYIIMLRETPTSGKIEFYSGVIDKDNLIYFKESQPKKDQFKIAATPSNLKSKLKNFQLLGTLNVETEDIRNAVKDSLIQLQQNVQPIYSALKDFTLNLHMYFGADKEVQRKSAAAKAKQSSKNLDTQAQTTIKV